MRMYILIHFIYLWFYKLLILRNFGKVFIKIAKKQHFYTFILNKRDKNYNSLNFLTEINSLVSFTVKLVIV